MKLCTCVWMACLLSLWAIAGGPAAWGQGYGASADHSIIRQTGYGWRNQVVVPDGHCGCDMPVRADCYDQPCCFRCGLHPLCFLQRVHRMLDCLLPCHKCCCGPFGGCLLGGRCGGCGCCDVACCGGGCGCSTGLPGFSDPFLDDPLPPKPMPDSGAEVRYQPPPPRRLAPAPRATPTAKAPSANSPWKVTGTPRARSASPRADLQASHRANDLRVVIHPAAPSPKPATQSVLRRTSAEEPATLMVEPEARPIIRSQTPEDSSDDAIPFNPLRAK